jgi:hypothetical protein
MEMYTHPDGRRISISSIYTETILYYTILYIYSTTGTLNSLNGRLKVSAKIQQATQHAEAAQASDAAGISRR